MSLRNKVIKTMSTATRNMTFVDRHNPIGESKLLSRTDQLGIASSARGIQFDYYKKERQKTIRKKIWKTADFLWENTRHELPPKYPTTNAVPDRDMGYFRLIFKH